MSRPTDTERGARIALSHAQAMLSAADGADLFPIRLTPKQRQLWMGIARVSQEQLSEFQAMREVLRG